jgi:hypothetical protein
MNTNKAEGFYKLKKYLKKTVLEDYQVTVSNVDTLRHYFESSDKLDDYFCEAMGWKHE